MTVQSILGWTRIATAATALLAVAIGLTFTLASDPALAQSNRAGYAGVSVTLTRADGTVTASWPMPFQRSHQVPRNLLLGQQGELECRRQPGR